MAPSTSSFLDLKAQLSKQEADFAQNRALGREMVVKGGLKRPGKVSESFHPEVVLVNLSQETYDMGSNE